MMMAGNVDSGSSSGGNANVMDIMTRICDIVEEEGLADGHPILTKLLKQK